MSAERARSLTAGQVLEDTYRIVRWIGEGGMGDVYEATHARLAGRYAIKLLCREAAADPEALARFKREAEITSSLQHPNIVQVVDFNTGTGGFPYLVMEYLPGESLAARLQRDRTVPAEQVVKIVEEVASALATAHRHDIVHRDLKPENVFLVAVEGTTSVVAKVLDFGISKVAHPSQRLTVQSTLLGTPHYMSPEQALSRFQEVDAFTDQYALAVLTYEMLTGRTPFDGDSVPSILYQVVHTDPLPMGTTAEVEAVVRRGLAKVKRSRFPTPVAFAQALAAAIAGRVTAEVTLRVSDGYPAGEINTRKTVRPPRRRAWGTAVGFGVALALGAAVIGTQEAGVGRLARPSPLATHTTAPIVRPSPDPKPVAPRVIEPIVAAARIDVLSAPTGMQVTVDGVLDQIPLRLPATGQVHHLRFEAPGFQPYEIGVVAREDQVVRLMMERSHDRSGRGMGRAGHPQHQSRHTATTTRRGSLVDDI